MAIDWGAGWVHPTDGSSGYDGRSQATPKATIEQAISAGFRVVNVAAGSHTLSTLSDEQTLILYPGTHTFLNAPVVTDKATSVVGVTPVLNKLNSAGSAYVTAPGTASSYFQIGSPPADPYPRGGFISNLFFDMQSVSKAAIDNHNVNYQTVQDCTFKATDGVWRNVPAIYSCGTFSQTGPPVWPGGDQSWNRWIGNNTLGCPLMHAPCSGPAMNRNVIAYNTCEGNGAVATSPYVNQFNLNFGLSLHDNHFEDVGSSAAYAVYGNNMNAAQIYGNSFANIATTNNITMQLNVLSASFVSFSRGAASTDGELKVITGSTTTYNSGGVNFEDDYNNRIIVMDRYSA